MDIFLEWEELRIVLQWGLAFQLSEKGTSARAADYSRFLLPKVFGTPNAQPYTHLL